MVKGFTSSVAQPKGGKGSKPVLKQTLKPDASERVKVTNHRVTGRLQVWKNTFGWIIPDTPINHPQATARGGKIYLAQEDVEKDLTDEAVSFLVYADSSGLGAMRCIPATGGAAVKGAWQSPQPPAQPPKLSKGAGKAAAPVGKAANGKAAGKDKGGKGGKAGKEKPFGSPPDKENRTPLDAPPVEGVVVKYANNVGWIKLDESAEIPEEHKDKLKRGTLYFHSTDVDGEEPNVGAQVMCFLYTDDNGMGGETLQVLMQGDGTVPKAEGEEEEKKTAGEDGPKKEKGAGKGKAKGKGKGGKGKGKGKEKGGNLQRERVTEAKVTGEVLAWTTKFGWLSSAEVDHPSLEKHDGRVFVHQSDLVGVETLEVGATVSFHVYTDAKGVGAEEVEQL